MEEFDYEQYRVIGYINSKLGDNAHLDVLGYCDSWHEFNQLAHSEISRLFPTRGKIFARKFFPRYESLKGSIVCLRVRPSKTDGSEIYEWDWNGDVIEYGKQISPLEGIFSSDGQYNYDILKNNDLLDINGEKLVFGGDKIYQISFDSSERVIKYWEESSLNIITIDGVKYLVGISLPKHDGLIDIMNDEQLASWYLSKVVKKNWANIIQGKSFRNSESFLVHLLSTLKGLDESTLQNRLKRLKKINANISLTFDTLNEISEVPWFGDVVTRSLADERVHILEQLKNENSTELNKIKADYELKLLNLKEEQDNKINELLEQKSLKEQELQEKNFEIELLDEIVTEKKKLVADLEKSIATLNSRKKSIIQDFSIIHEVFKMSGVFETKITKEITKSFSHEEINISDKPISRFQAYVKSLENILKFNGASKCKPVEMSKVLAAYNVVLCPSLSIAQSFIMASHKCKYLTEYVSAKWTSFKDLWENGLEYMVTQSIEEPDIMHFLLLQNINISYLPNFMQPLVDFQKRIITKFPDTGIPFPPNLRILCTIVENDELIPMSKDVIRNFGCIDKSFYFEYPSTLDFADDANLGYLIPEELIQERKQITEVQNMFEQYIDE
ncbi:MAG: hypothetical protein II235_01960 [Muribaculaceae bacterium]|nr:hypothetical protein [Muribaculaceae bacterium]